MKLPILSAGLSFLLAAATSFAAEPTASTVVPPGQAIVPSDSRKPWGELISLDLKNRTGKFRNESTDEAWDFVVEPYAELLHHGADGDLQDFTVGERAIFRCHPGAEGEPWRLTYIQSEINFLNGHKEFFFVDKIDTGKIDGTPAAGKTVRLTCHQANADQSYVRTPELFIDVDENTKYFRNGKPAAFADLKVGDPIQTKTRGTGKGKDRIAVYVFLDVPSLQKFAEQQRPIHAQRMREEGLAGFVDKVEGETIHLTLFRETGTWAKKLKPGMTVKLAAAGPDRQATGEPIECEVAAAKMLGVHGKISVTTSSPVPAAVKPTAVVRLFAPQVFE